jgi:hypothetical protein
MRHRGDLTAAAAALLNEHESAWGEARVPASGVVWWRAQVRAREEAARGGGEADRVRAGRCGVVCRLGRGLPPAGVSPCGWPELAGLDHGPLGERAGLLRRGGIRPRRAAVSDRGWRLPSPCASCALHRTARSTPGRVEPGAHLARAVVARISPGRAPVCTPFRTTATPLTITYTMPAANACGFSNVAVSITVDRSKMVTSAA